MKNKQKISSISQTIDQAEIELPLMEVAEIKLAYSAKIKHSLRPKITSAEVAYRILRQAWDETKIDFIEQFKIILTARDYSVLGVIDISTGGISGTVTDPKIIFGATLKACASGLILAHNHPSGNRNPSNSDISLTRKIRDAARLLDIDLIDHLIVNREGYFSFSEEGIL